MGSKHTDYQAYKIKGRKQNKTVVLWWKFVCGVSLCRYFTLTPVLCLYCCVSSTGCCTLCVTTGTPSGLRILGDSSSARVMLDVE